MNSVITYLNKKLPYMDNKTAGDSFHEKGHLGFQSMSLAIFAGVLAGLCRVVARRVSLKVY